MLGHTVEGHRCGREEIRVKISRKGGQEKESIQSKKDKFWEKQTQKQLVLSRQVR